MQSVSQPLVSIIIPCYNAERYVREAVQSALDQTYPSIEVIVVDDGSTDGSLGILRSFGDRIRLDTGPNRGAAAARNLGIELSKGELVQFSDADDLLCPDKIQRQIEWVLKGAADIVFTDGSTINPRNRTEERRFTYPDAGPDAVLFAVKTGVATPAPLHWKRNIVAVNGFSPGLTCAQEYDLHLRMACAGMTFQRMPEQLFKVRLLSNSISSNYLKVLGQHENILWDAYRSLESCGTLSPERARGLAATMARAGRHCLQQGDKVRGTEYFRQARLMHPDGVLDVYSPPARWAYRIFGPAITEKIARFMRHSPTAQS